MRIPSTVKQRAFRSSMTLATLLVFLFISSFGSSARNRKAEHFDYLTQVGVAARTSKGTCLSIANPSMRIGSRVFLISFSSRQNILKARIAGKLQTPCLQPDGSGISFDGYELRLTGASAQEGSPLIAVYGFRGKFSNRDESVTADLDGGGHPEFFRSCTSQEGIHLTIWSDKPLEGIRRWHRYVHLGYAVEPSCTEAETKPDPNGVAR
jgi:hypothetical protein